MEAKKRKILVEKVEILDESTGQIILKEQARVVYSNNNDSDSEQLANPTTTTIQLIDKNCHAADIDNNEIDFPSKKQNVTGDFEEDLIDDLDSPQSNSHDITSNSSFSKPLVKCPNISAITSSTSLPQHIIIIESNNSSSSSSNSSNSTSSYSQSAISNKQALLSAGLSPHIVQNYSILAQEITAPLENKQILIRTTQNKNNNTNESNDNSWSSNQTNIDLNSNNNRNITISTDNLENGPSNSSNTSSSTVMSSSRAQKDLATCQFCGRAMLKKNIPTHIRRAHTPKEELVCLNEEQNIFTLHHLKPGQRRKRSARAYDYSLMTATVSIDEDPCEGIENKFVTEGEEILSSDLLQLADRVKYGISQISTNTLTKLIDILGKIETSTQGDVSSNSKSIRNMILIYLTSGEEFKYKLRQVGDDIIEKKKQVNNLRSDLKEVMSRKAQLERKIQPLVCELQKLEDQHGNLMDSINQLNDQYQFEYVQEIND